jgi:hypothetical protein
VGPPERHEIFAVTRAIRESDNVLVCRLLEGKVTFVHRRLWPALVSAANRIPSDHISQVREVHTHRGRHVTKEVSFPDWVPSSILAAARVVSENGADAELAQCRSGLPARASDTAKCRGGVQRRVFPDWSRCCWRRPFTTSCIAFTSISARRNRGGRSARSDRTILHGPGRDVPRFQVSAPRYVAILEFRKTLDLNPKSDQVHTRAGLTRPAAPRADRPTPHGEQARAPRRATPPPESTQRSQGSRRPWATIRKGTHRARAG